MAWWQVYHIFALRITWGPALRQPIKLTGNPEQDKRLWLATVSERLASAIFGLPFKVVFPHCGLIYGGPFTEQSGGASGPMKRFTATRWRKGKADW